MQPGAGNRSRQWAKLQSAHHRKTLEGRTETGAKLGLLYVPTRRRACAFGAGTAVHGSISLYLPRVVLHPSPARKLTAGG